MATRNLHCPSEQSACIDVERKSQLGDDIDRWRWRRLRFDFVLRARSRATTYG